MILFETQLLDCVLPHFDDLQALIRDFTEVKFKKKIYGKIRVFCK